MKKIGLLFSLLIMSEFVISQSNKSVDTNIRLLDSVRQKLSGVKYVRLITTKDLVEIYKNNMSTGNVSADLLVAVGFSDYVSNDLKKAFVLTDEQIEMSYADAKSSCDFVLTEYSIGDFVSDFGAIGRLPLTVTFTFCDGSAHTFTKDVKVNGLSNYRIAFRKGFNNIINLEFDKTNYWMYNVDNRLKMPSNPLIIEHDKFMQHLDTSKLVMKNEGVFELFSSDDKTANYKVGIYNDSGTLKMIYFDGAKLKDDWKDGELKGILNNTKSDGDYILRYYNASKNEIKGFLTFVNENSFTIKLNNGKGVDKYIRIR